jgi:E3 ubiquitin-protein ligase SHPRH
VSGDRVKTARLAWRFAGEDDENEDAWRPERAPSFDVATALLFLLDRGRFALRLVDRDATRCVLAVLVAPDALDAPTHPEEFARKAHHAKQRSALAWLAPPPRGTLERYAAGIDGEKGGAEGGADDPTAVQSPLVPASHNLLHGVYEAAKPPRDTPDVCGGCAFEQLVPTPRPYQRRAVDWMIRRERGGAPAASKRGDGACTKEDDACAKALHPLWSELGDAAVYVNWNTGQLTRRRFDAHVAEPSGGILADEMGLGKTVELMMCVLAHRYVPPAAVKEERGRRRRRPRIRNQSTAKTTTSRRKTKSSGACAATPTMTTRACGSRVTSATSGPTRVASDTQRRMRPATAKKRKRRFKSQSKLEPL